MYNALKQSTASQAIKVGPVVNASGAWVTDAVIGDFQAAKNGGALAALHTTTIAYDAAGVYTITLDATDTNTLGRLVVHCVKASTIAPPSRYQVVTANVYDSLVSGTDLLDANAKEIGDTTQTTGKDIMACVGTDLAGSPSLRSYVRDESGVDVALLVGIAAGLHVSGGATINMGISGDVPCDGDYVIDSSNSGYPIFTSVDNGGLPVVWYEIANDQWVMSQNVGETTNALATGIGVRSLAIFTHYTGTTSGTATVTRRGVNQDAANIPTAAQTAAAVAAQARGTVEGSIGKGIADAASAAGAAQTAAEAVQAKLPSAGGIIGTSTLTQLQAQAAVDAALDATDTDTTSGWATTLRGKIRQLYRSVFGKNVYDRTAQTRTMYADDGTTARTTQTWASTAQTQSTSKAT